MCAIDETCGEILAAVADDEPDDARELLAAEVRALRDEAKLADRAALAARTPQPADRRALAKDIAGRIDWMPTCELGGTNAAIVDQVLRLAAAPQPAEPASTTPTPQED